MLAQAAASIALAARASPSPSHCSGAMRSLGLRRRRGARVMPVRSCAMLRTSLGAVAHSSKRLPLLDATR
jgi:hypothetical protein